ncbi:secreted protein [Tahibacter aquaticus]|uniref:Secreted protein n=1 Tax=Tahibacter aquaticus TaxID=520092 RepID=A0A4R6YU32_9GAMM|nr:FAD-dependent oxidoreductase [Tahibacter aquaticus]TDR42016.1 secreted protein [Tahibacter aquaticus]
MSDDGKPVTRRQFLQMVGAAGGAAAVYETMVVLGMLAVPAVYAGPPDTSGSPGKGRTVIVLGAGVAGLTAALRLKQAGYQVAVYEASDRIGGRNFTVSTAKTDHRDVIRQHGKADQTCAFEGSAASQYFEAGCGRIPYHHVALLELCQELKVALQPYIMETRANRFQTDAAFGRQPVVNRQLANDTRGYIAELLAKAINKQCLDDALSEADRKAMLSLLSTFGEVSEKSSPPYTYKGSTRSGYAEDPGVVSPGKPVAPLALAELLKSEFWKHRFYQAEDYLWQTTLFHPVGGMRKIVDALQAGIGGSVKTSTPALKIVNGKDSVAVLFQDGTRVTADYCISTVPLPVLKNLLDSATFSAPYREAVGLVEFAKTCKIGWQATQRFWEKLRGPNATNGPQIFGGISWIDHPITQMWYPSADYFAPGPAVLTGAYNYDSPGKPVATDFGKLGLAERLELGLKGGERLHAEFRQFVPAGKGLSIAWQEVPFIGGGWAEWDRANPKHAEAYRRLLLPEQRFIVAGDQVSYLPGWMEGAVLSAYHVVEQVMGRAKPRLLEGLDGLEAPDSAKVSGAG